MKEVIDTVSVALANGETENVGNAVMQEVNRYVGLGQSG